MCVGGLLSLASIFIFFNTTGEWAQDSLKRGLVELRYGNIDEQTMLEEGDKIMAEKEIISNLEYNLFSGKNFFIYYRSEERRVGKECRYRWRKKRYKKNVKNGNGEESVCKV